jgi:hypothetical protein
MIGGDVEGQEGCDVIVDGLYVNGAEKKRKRQAGEAEEEDEVRHHPDQHHNTIT